MLCCPRAYAESSTHTCRPVQCRCDFILLTHWLVNTVRSGRSQLNPCCIASLLFRNLFAEMPCTWRRVDRGVFRGRGLIRLWSAQSPWNTQRVTSQAADGGDVAGDGADGTVWPPPRSRRRPRRPRFSRPSGRLAASFHALWISESSWSAIHTCVHRACTQRVVWPSWT